MPTMAENVLFSMHARRNYRATSSLRDKDSGFDIINTEYIGSHSYEPLADYDAQNRKIIKSIILKERTSSLSSYLQSILYNVIDRALAQN